MRSIVRFSVLYQSYTCVCRHPNREAEQLLPDSNLDYQAKSTLLWGGINRVNSESDELSPSLFVQLIDRDPSSIVRLSYSSIAGH